MCTRTAGCDILNYNLLSMQNTCELMTSGQTDISFMTSQPGWNVYFGNAGLELIQQITSSANYELRIDLEDFEGGHFFAEYGSFQIGGAESDFKLYVGSYTGNAGDCFSNLNNRSFSTYDHDNDMLDENCAELYHGAWWYNACHFANLNGLYSPVGNVTDYGKHINWNCLHGFYYSFKTTEMKMRKTLQLPAK